MHYSNSVGTWQAWHHLSKFDHKLLEVLDYYRRKYKTIYPSQATLAYHLQCSIRTVRRSVAHIKALFLVAVQARKYRDRLGRIRSHSNVYALLTNIQEKIRATYTFVTGRTKLSSLTKTKEKKELFRNPVHFLHDRNTPDTRPDVLFDPGGIKNKPLASLLSSLGQKIGWAGKGKEG